MTYDYNLSAEERDILEMVERNELRPIPNAEQEKEYAQQAARNTLKKMKRGNKRKTERDFQSAYARPKE